MKKWKLDFTKATYENGTPISEETAVIFSNFAEMCIDTHAAIKRYEFWKNFRSVAVPSIIVIGIAGGGYLIIRHIKRRKEKTKS